MLSPRMPVSCCLPLIFRHASEMFVLEAEGPNLYQLRRVHPWTKGSALRPLGARNSSCHLCVPSITLKDCPVILSGERGFSSPFIKPREQRQPGEGLRTSKQAVTRSVRPRLPPGGLGAVYRWEQINAGEKVAQFSLPPPPTLTQPVGGAGVPDHPDSPAGLGPF